MNRNPLVAPAFIALFTEWANAKPEENGMHAACSAVRSRNALADIYNGQMLASKDSLHQIVLLLV